MEEQGRRLEASRSALNALRPAVERREPWPLSDAYGAEPESAWGPKEVLAHVAEMVPYWLAQIDSILVGPAAPAPFGRVATDPERIGRIGRDRGLPAGELFRRIDEAVATVVARLDQLDSADRARLGIHPRLGEMTVEAIGERFIIAHLDEHVRQLEEILDRRGQGEPDP
jgi:hypothetical protein